MRKNWRYIDKENSSRNGENFKDLFINLILSLVYYSKYTPYLIQQYTMVHLELMDDGKSKLAPVSQRGLVRDRSQRKLSNRKSPLVRKAHSFRENYTAENQEQIQSRSLCFGTLERYLPPSNSDYNPITCL